jgi:hypothetical protein
MYTLGGRPTSSTAKLGSSDPAVSGTETFWNPNRSFSDRSERLTDLTQMNMAADLAAAGYKTHDRGARTDASLATLKRSRDAGSTVQGTLTARPVRRPYQVAACTCPPSLTLRGIDVLLRCPHLAADDQQVGKLHTGERVRAGGRCLVAELVRLVMVGSPGAILASARERRAFLLSHLPPCIWSRMEAYPHAGC